MPELCCCGNLLRKEPRFKVVKYPCQCEKPGTERRRPPKVGLSDYVDRRTYEQRTRLGLPVQTEVEKSVGEKWG